jgi:cold-inducible RNA-binding protein
MNRKLYVGNLAFSTDDQTLNAMFAEAGPVDSVRIVADQATGRSRGFAFVEMATDEGAKAAIERFNEKEVDGRRLTVNEARPKTNDGGSYAGAGGGGGRRREPRW